MATFRIELENADNDPGVEFVIYRDDKRVAFYDSSSGLCGHVKGMPDGPEKEELRAVVRARLGGGC